ncbi:MULTISPECIES: ArsR/SmtB family transcription factor [Streptomyces]|uniref:ArsR/SmtB family transcription factor n=1 Tax=Streptomyces TaxID=1883 RepID=UPI0006EB98F7|nr:MULTISPECIES: helix-turn-helix domain-containing protein [Streptomyces]
MSRQQRRRVTDLGTLKAFGHPLRLRLYGALKVAPGRTATASRLADEVDEAVSLVSYHLRKLAEHGLIEEAPQAQRGDGRERWWTPAQETLSFHTEDFQDTPEKAATLTAVTRALHAQRTDLLDVWLGHRSAWTPEWRNAADNSDFLARFTADELTALTEELHAVVRRYEARAKDAEEAGDTEGRENVLLFMHSFPFRSL